MILSKNVWLCDETFREKWAFSRFAARLKPDVENIAFFDTSAFLTRFRDSKGRMDLEIRWQRSPEWPKALRLLCYSQSVLVRR